MLGKGKDGKYTTCRGNNNNNNMKGHWCASQTCMQMSRLGEHFPLMNFLNVVNRKYRINATFFALNTSAVKDKAFCNIKFFLFFNFLSHVLNKPKVTFLCETCKKRADYYPLTLIVWWNTFHSVCYSGSFRVPYCIDIYIFQAIPNT